MEALLFIIGIAAGMVSMYMWIVPSSRFGHPDCKHCDGTGKTSSLWEDILIWRVKMTTKQMQKACAHVIEKRMERLRAPKTETFRDAASGRSETIKKGEWQGSLFEFELFTALLTEINAIKIN